MIKLTNCATNLPQEISEALRSIVPTSVSVAVQSITDIAEPPPGLADVLPDAVPSRQREFAAGRLAASAALRKLGANPVFPTRSPDRAPIWPNGVVGSIAHDDAWAIAGVALEVELEAIGIDVEPIRSLDEDLVSRVLTSNEVELLGASTDQSLETIVVDVFSIKESVFKCLYPRCRTILEFHDIEVAIEDDGVRLVSANIGNGHHRLVSSIECSLIKAGDRVLTAAWIRSIEHDS